METHLLPLSAHIIYFLLNKCIAEEPKKKKKKNLKYNTRPSFSIWMLSDLTPTLEHCLHFHDQLRETYSGRVGVC